MRLSELKRIPKEFVNLSTNIEPSIFGIIQSKDYGDQLTDLITKYGLKELGQGAWGMTFEVPNRNYILKIFPKTDNGFTNWVDVCRREKSAYLPKFFSKLISVGDFYGVKMERLTPVEYDKIFAMSLYYICKNYNEMETFYKTKDISFIPKDEFAELISKEILNSEIFNDEELWRACKIIHDNSKSHIDIHLQNLMSRNGQLVISDPYGPTIG